MTYFNIYTSLSKYIPKEGAGRCGLLGAEPVEPGRLQHRGQRQLRVTLAALRGETPRQYE